MTISVEAAFPPPATGPAAPNAANSYVVPLSDPILARNASLPLTAPEQVIEIPIDKRAQHDRPNREVYLPYDSMSLLSVTMQ